jgi:hypothetical protein
VGAPAAAEERRTRVRAVGLGWCGPAPEAVARVEAGAFTGAPGGVVSWALDGWRSAGSAGGGAADLGGEAGLGAAAVLAAPMAATRSPLRILYVPLIPSDDASWCSSGSRNAERGPLGTDGAVSVVSVTSILLHVDVLKRTDQVMMSQLASDHGR